MKSGGGRSGRAVRAYCGSVAAQPFRVAARQPAMNPTTIEVEQKYAITDPAALEVRLARLGVQLSEPVWQEDLYYAHPTRDFRATDEALRVRQVNAHTYVTYKGPRLDDRTKTREEVEVPLPEGIGVAKSCHRLLERLGFRPAGVVRKRRRSGTCLWCNRSVTVAWDEVVQLGSFLELELVCPPDQVAIADRCLDSLRHELRLSHAERRSYLELLLP